MHTKLFGVTVIALLAMVLGNGCSSYRGTDTLSGTEPVSNLVAQTLRGITYTPENWSQPLQGDLYLPEKTGLLPVVLVVHGGGWSGRSRNDMDSVSEKLVRHGYAVFNISYRFAPENVFPAQYHDLRQAMRWLADHAAQYRFDLERINAWGYSSGAHLVALLASVDSRNQNLQPLDEKLPAIRAVVAGGIPADLRKYRRSPIIIPFLGGDLDEIPQTYALASPTFHISSDDPPVFLYHGALDNLVEKEQASDYFVALRAAGIDAGLYLHNVWGHFAMFLFGREAEDKALDFLNLKNS